MGSKSKNRTLSREEWLEKALVVVSRAGGAKLRVESLVAAVGVTKGSFYWHFRSRDHFVTELINYWHDRYTLSVVRHFDALDDTAGDKLRQVMEMVFVNRLARHDLAFRSWAIAEPHLRKLVKRTQSDADRRVWHVALTARGERLWAKLEGELLAIDAEVLSSLDASERETLIRTMDALARATRAWREEKASES